SAACTGVASLGVVGAAPAGVDLCWTVGDAVVAVCGDAAPVVVVAGAEAIEGIAGTTAFRAGATADAAADAACTAACAAAVPAAPAASKVLSANVSLLGVPSTEKIPDVDCDPTMVLPVALSLFER